MMKLFFDEHETKKKGSGVLTEKRKKKKTCVSQVIPLRIFYCIN